MDDDRDEVLGNLPRSRPGRRSDKRPSAAAERAAEEAERRGSAARGAPGATGAPPAAEPAPDSGGSDPVGGALRFAGRAAEAGLQLAGGISREILRRIPRP